MHKGHTSGMNVAGEALICDDLLFSLALMLGPLGIWRLQMLSIRVRRVISIEALPQLRKVWASDSGHEDTRLVDLVRAASPSFSTHEQKVLLQACGRCLLLNPGSSLVADDSGQTTLTWAAEYALEDLLGLLLGPVSGTSSEVQAALQIRESNGWYPLFRAAWGGRTGCIKLILAANGNPEGLDGRYSPLMSAARWGHQDAVSLLLDARASPTRKNRFGEDAGMLARGQGHTSVVQLLKQAVETAESTGDDTSAHVAEDEWRNEVNSRRARHTLGPGWVALGKDFYIQ